MDSIETALLFFSKFGVDIRASLNGATTIHALCLAAVMAAYITRRVRVDRQWWRRAGSQGAIAVLLSSVGLAIWAGAQWLTFLWLDIGWSPHVWSGWIVFAFAMLFILTGQVLMLYWFAEPETRMKITVVSIIVAVCIPVSLAIVF